MGENGESTSLMILVVGAAVVLALLSKALLRRLRVPPVVGYLLLGMLLGAADTHWGFLSRHSNGVFAFLADLGIVSLLFRVGLESNLPALIHELRRATPVWLAGILVSGLCGYAACWLLGIDSLSAVIVATALTATSVGVTVGVWRDAGAMESENGRLLLDVAEMDDLSGVLLMAVLFAVLPVLHDGNDAAFWPTLLSTAFELAAGLVGFGVFCVLFSRYAEEPMTRFFRGMERGPDPMLTVAGTGFIIASLVALLGFSVAIGAFFAGLLFSRDPESVRIDASFGTLYEFFSPFFFIGIGLQIDPHVLAAAVGPGSVLLIAAVLGKVIGHGLPAWGLMGHTTGILIGVSMVPRAEIAMVIMQRGKLLGDWAVPEPVFAAVMLVSAATCLLAPLSLHPLLRRWPQQADGEDS